MGSQPAIWSSLISVGIGAVLGAWLRWGLSLWLNPGPGRLAWGTLLANLLGAYLIGLCLSYAAYNPQWSTHLRLLVVTGFLGALTTFSTFSSETFTYIMSGRWGLALLYAGISVAGSLLMTFLGWQTLQALQN